MKTKIGGNGTRHNQLLHEQRMAAMTRRAEEEAKPVVTKRRGEPTVVPCYQLAAVLREWSRRWLAERPANAGANGGMDYQGPIDHLSKESGIPQRRISDYANERVNVVGETRAEKLLIAMGLEHMFSTGEVQVVPSPYWTFEQYTAYLEDCGCL